MGDGGEGQMSKAVGSEDSSVTFCDFSESHCLS